MVEVEDMCDNVFPQEKYVEGGILFKCKETGELCEPLNQRSSCKGIYDDEVARKCKMYPKHS